MQLSGVRPSVCLVVCQQRGWSLRSVSGLLSTGVTLQLAREANAKRILYRFPRPLEALLFEWQPIACVAAGTLLLRRANRNSRSGNSTAPCALLQ